MRTRVEVERSGRPIRPIARLCCNVTRGAWLQTRDCKANAPRRRHFAPPPLRLGRGESPKAEQTMRRERPVDEHDVFFFFLPGCGG